MFFHYKFKVYFEVDFGMDFNDILVDFGMILDDILTPG